MATLLDGLDLSDDADILGIDGAISDAIAGDIYRVFSQLASAKVTTSSKTKRRKTTSKTENPTATPEVWQQSDLFKTELIPAEGDPVTGQGS